MSLLYIYVGGGRGRKRNWWILFCPFVILGSNVSLSHCLSKREFRDCQTFSENRRSSDWSARKSGFFFFSSLVWDFFDNLLKSTFVKQKGKDSFVWGNWGRSFWHYYFIGGKRCFNQFSQSSLFSLFLIFYCLNISL